MASLRAVLPGDIVECDVRGREFIARVAGPARKEQGNGLVVDVEPITRGITHYTVRGRDVRAIYRRLGRRRGGE